MSNKKKKNYNTYNEKKVGRKSFDNRSSADEEGIFDNSDFDENQRRKDRRRQNWENKKNNSHRRHDDYDDYDY